MARHRRLSRVMACESRDPSRRREFVSQSERKVRVALLGCGTVGGGVIRLLVDRSKQLSARIGANIEIKRVLVRDPSKVRLSECRSEWLTSDPEVVFNDPEIDIVIEVMGGTEPAKAYIERAIALGKSVVSANKYLLARHGADLVAAAVGRGVDLAFEASVGGGIPVIRALRDSLASDHIESIHALLNGTCNYMLTRMRNEGLGFAEVLKDAQRLGYAEAEPSLDVDGHDAAQKLVVLCMLAFGARVDEADVHVEGIRAIDEVDFRFAERFDFSIKHVAVAQDRGSSLEVRVHPALLPLTNPLANVHGVLNGVLVHGRAVGPCLLVGQGAGEMPTAVSIVADVVDVARARVEGAGGLATRVIRPERRALRPLRELESRYYLRFDVNDEPGVLGTIASALGRHRISVEHMVQEGHLPERNLVPVLMITHVASEGAIQAALAEIAGYGFMGHPARVIRIEDV
jgi:homoserine dehydrogenase